MNRRELLQISALGPMLPPALAQMSQWKPKVFTPAQNETVVVLTELIIPATDTPGAKAANVNRYIDLILSAGPAEEKDRFLEGLKFLDDSAKKQHRQPFAKLTAAQQTAILEAFDAGEQGETAAGHRFFRMAKQLTSRIYYATEIGYKELNKGGRVPAGVGCNA